MRPALGLRLFRAGKGLVALPRALRGSVGGDEGEEVEIIEEVVYVE